MQAGYCFQFTENGVEGLAKNKKMICITSRGGDYSPSSPVHSLDYQEPYLRAIFGFTGIEDITFLNAQPLDVDPSITEAKLQDAKEKARQLAQGLEIPEAVSAQTSM